VQDLDNRINPLIAINTTVSGKLHAMDETVTPNTDTILSSVFGSNKFQQEKVQARNNAFIENQALK
jgi:hypothetical protein